MPARRKRALREPRPAFRTTRTAAAALPPGVSAAQAAADDAAERGAAARTGAEIMARDAGRRQLAQFIDAKLHVKKNAAYRRSVAAAERARVQSASADDSGAAAGGGGGGPPKSTETAAKETLLNGMCERGIAWMRLGDECVLRRVDKPATGVVRGAVWAQLDTITPEAVQAAITETVIPSIAQEAARAKGRKRPTNAQRAVQASLDGEGQHTEAPPGAEGTVRASVAASVAECIQDSLRKVKHKKKRRHVTGADAASVMSGLQSEPSIAAAQAAFGVLPRTAASLVGSQHGGDLDLASAVAEAVYCLINPPRPTLSVVLGPPKRDPVPVADFFEDATPEEQAAAQMVLTARMRRRAKQATDRAARAALKQAEEADGFVIEDELPAAAAAAPKATAAAAAAPDTDTAIAPPAPVVEQPSPALPALPGADRAKADVEALEEGVAEMILAHSAARGDGGAGTATAAADAVSINMTVSAPDGRTEVTVTAKRTEETMEAFTWSRLTRALREAVSVAVLQHTDENPDLPCRRMLKESPGILQAVITAEVLLSAFEGLRASAEAYKKANTVVYAKAILEQTKPARR